MMQHAFIFPRFVKKEIPKIYKLRSLQVFTDGEYREQTQSQ